MQRFISKVSRRHLLQIAGAQPVVMALSKLSFAAEAAKPKIGFIGAGRIATAIGSSLVTAGYQVMFSSRNPEELKDLVSRLGANARAGTVEQAAAFGDVVVLTVPYSAMPTVAKQIGPQLATKSLVLDVSNPISSRDGEMADKVVQEGPAAYLSRLMPGVKIVRGFNSIGSGRYPALTRDDGQKLGNAMAGDDPKALAIATQMSRDIGLEPVVVGPLSIGKFLYRPYTYFNGAQTAEEIRKVAPTLGK